MKLTDHFTNFLTDTVNLNATRVTNLDSSAEALETFIKASDWGPKGVRFAAQGSWAHKTIIKPVNGRPFDADLLVFVNPVAGWDAKTYIAELRRVFLASATYSDKVRRYSHCVTIEYSGERKIDIAPVVVNRNGLGALEVCNFNTNQFEVTAPEAYTDWLSERNKWTGGNGLKKATRLLKYLRDIKTTFTYPSFLLTTLLGMQINAWDEHDTKAFADVPTALKTIVGRLDNWLQANVQTPTVRNPALWSEIQSLAWDDTKYANFRDKIHMYREWIDDAYDEADRDESIGKWRRVFGDEFAESVVIEKAANVSALAANRALVAADGFGGFNGDLVALYARLGPQALPENFDRLPHKQRPRWPKSPQPLFSVTVDARLHSQRRGAWLETLTPDRRAPLRKGQSIHLMARTSTGVPLAGDFDIFWRVTNTDQEAKAARAMRGEFVKANDGSAHWEDLAYRGVHSVEAFIVRKRGQLLVTQSAPFTWSSTSAITPMTRDVNEAFDILLSWIRPSETETDRASSHRASIEACLKAKFGMTNFFRAGSFGHGTSVRGYSDIDYFAVIPEDNLYSDSGLALRSMKEVLAARFPRTEVYVHSPAVAVRFGTEDWERHEITPVYFDRTEKHYNVYSMPDRYGGWMRSSPKGLKASINEQNDRLSKKAKQLVRLVKLWNYACDVGIRSIYLELRVAQYLSTETTVVYPIDVMGALRHIAGKDLAGMQDPLGLGAVIYPCSAAAKPAALSKLNTAVTRAEKAVAANSEGRQQDAFAWWDKVYAGGFPSYY